jgi:hypothetical protein
LEDLGTDGRILKWILKIEWMVVEGIHLAQGMNQWWALVNTVMTFWVP